MADSNYSPGERVKVTAGSFADFAGVVADDDEVAPAADNTLRKLNEPMIKVRLNIFGRPVSVELPISIVARD